MFRNLFLLFLKTNTPRQFITSVNVIRYVNKHDKIINQRSFYSNVRIRLHILKEKWNAKINWKYTKLKKEKSLNEVSDDSISNCAFNRMKVKNFSWKFYVMYYTSTRFDLPLNIAASSETATFHMVTLIH